MGSEGPPAVTIHVTGFKKFHGVSENPTETIVSNLKEYMKKKGMPKGCILGSCNVLETAGQGALAPLYQILQSAISEEGTDPSNSGRIIWVSCPLMSSDIAIVFIIMQIAQLPVFKFCFFCIIYFVEGCFQLHGCKNCRAPFSTGERLKCVSWN